MLSYGVCVKSCPTNDTSEPVECKATKYTAGNSEYSNCVQYVGRSGLNPGVAFRYNTKSILGNFCIPDGADYMDSSTVEAFKKAFFDSVYG